MLFLCYFPFLLLVGSCVGGSGDAQKEAPLNIAIPEARSEGEPLPTGLEPAASGRRDARLPELVVGGGRGRRRHADYATRAPQQRPQAHSAPNTMSKTLYDHFRPLDPELPSGDLLPFLQFGMKLPVAKVKSSVQKLSTTAATPSASSTFPSASTNALIQHQEDNEMSTVEEDSRTQGRAKLKAAIMLQMVVNSAKRKKLVQREQLRSKAGSKEEGIKLDADDEESLVATNSKRRLVIDGKKINGEDVDSGEIAAFQSDESEEIVQNDAPDEETFTDPPEIEAKEWKVAPAPKIDSTEDLSITDSSEAISSADVLSHHSKDDTTPDIPKKNAVHRISNKSSTDAEVDTVTTSLASLTPTPLPASPSTMSPTLTSTPSSTLSPQISTHPSNSTSPTSASNPSSAFTPFPSSFPDSLPSSSTPYSPDVASTASPPPPSSSSTLETISISNPILSTSQSTPYTAMTTSTLEGTSASTQTVEAAPISSTSTTTASTTISSTTEVSTTTSSTTETSTTKSSTTTTASTNVTSATSTTTTASTSSALITVSTTTTTSTAPTPTASLPPIAPPLRYPTKIRLSQYPTLLSNHPIPSPPSFNSTLARHPLLHREHHRPPHLIFIPPSLRPPIPRRSFPPPPFIPAKKIPQSPTVGLSPPSMPKKEPPVKEELDARDWVAVPPPNTTSSPSVSSTVNSLPDQPLSTKPSHNKVEKSRPIPYHQPHTFPPFIHMEGHFSLPLQPDDVTSDPESTSEVLSVVTSVSVENAPKINPALLTTTTYIPITVGMIGSGSVGLGGSLTGSPNEIGVDNVPSQYPNQVGIFAEESVDLDSSAEEEEGQVVDSDPEVVAELGMASTTTYVLLSLAVVPGLVAIASAARCLLLHRKKSLYESETSSEVSCMGGRTLKTCSRSSQGGAVGAEESTTSDMFRVITRLPRVAHLGWEDERRRGKMLHAEEEKEDSLQIESWEFPRSKLRLQTLLGQGNFGQVWKAEADGICDGEGSTRLVAVKLVKVKDGEDEEDVAALENSPSSESPLSRRQGELFSPMEQCRRKRREEFMAELGIMQLLSPPHPNVVTLLGCCTTTEPPLLIMEYVMFGKLLTFLREHRSKRRYANTSDDPEILTSRDLLIFSYCVIKGMEYLVSKGVVHRDLAARNILVDHNKTCKIADFGMSRCVTNTGGQVYEEKQKQGALPVRWMAPESLFRGTFTHKSDVWSFGVLLWEIMTLGSTPYPGIGARDVMRRVRDGRRLERPPHVRLELFRVAARCWHRDSSLRPTFSRLRADMGPILASAPSNVNHNSGAMDRDISLVSSKGNRRWRPPGPQIDLNQFEDDSS